ncbi:MAG: proteobacterial dedicated sortase system histidine kinase [Colwellia sp.]
MKQKLVGVRFGLRSKLLLLSSFLFVIPWFGYQYVWEMEKYLRFGQEQTLVGTARALATALHERENLFNKQASFLPSVEQGKDLYSYRLTQAIQLNGLHNDWPNFDSKAHFYDEKHKLFSNGPLNINFKASVGKYDKYLYMFLQVVDNNVVYRSENALSITNNDHLALSFSDNDGNFYRYIVSNKQPGWLSAYRVQSDDAFPQPAPKIQGTWLETSQGYNIELRIPLTNIGDNIAFAVYDSNKKNTKPIAAVGSADPNKKSSLGTILVPSPEIERIVKGMKYTNSSIWVVDQHHRVLASAGKLNQANGVWNAQVTLNKAPEENSLWHQFNQHVLLPMYYTVLTKPANTFIDRIYDAKHLEGEHIVSALSGQSKSQWRLTTDQKALVLSAAYPIYINDKVQGAVIVEETTNGIRTLRNEALEKLFTNILAILILGALTFILFASRISSRIRQLSNQAEQAIDGQGRIKGEMLPSSSNDEIGDLSRSFTTAVNRLSQYNHYLENMSSRLSHELRTPIAVVKTSLETLTLQSDGVLNKNNASQSDPSLSLVDNPYILRAQTGINTLNLILKNMSESTQLEQMLTKTQKINFNLTEVVSGCIAGYEQVYPKLNFKFKCNVSKIKFFGSPEHIVQLLDKVINNAVEFSADQQITISLALSNKTEQNIVLLVENNGELLPNELNDYLFDSMISVRKVSSLNFDAKSPVQNKAPHLGLGLYIARLICEFHQGSIKAYNHHDPDGASIEIKLPIINS